MIISIEQLRLEELTSFLQEQSEESFPDLKDGERLRMLAEKWHSKAEFCTCRDDSKYLIGMVAFYANQPQNSFVYIPHVYIRSIYRGKKLMVAMFDTIKQYVVDKEFEYLRLEVKKTNKRAQVAYLHYGFYYYGEASEESLILQCKI